MSRNEHSARSRKARAPRRAVAAGVLASALCLPGLAAAQVQPYVTGKLGYANSEFALESPYNGRVDDGSIAFGFAVGAEVGEYLGFELAHTRYGDFDGTATPCPVGEPCTQVLQDTSGNDARTFTATLVPQVMLGRADVFTRIGYYRAKIDTEDRFGGAEFTENGLLLGAGARWDFEDRPLNLSVEAARFDDNLYQFTVGFGWQPEILSE